MYAKQSSESVSIFWLKDHGMILNCLSNKYAISLELGRDES